RRRELLWKYRKLKTPDSNPPASISTAQVWSFHFLKVPRILLIFLLFLNPFLIIPFSTYFLKHIQRLFLYLFKLVLHFNYNLLHWSIIGLTADGVDFTSNFLSDKGQLFSIRIGRF